MQGYKHICTDAWLQACVYVAHQTPRQDSFGRWGACAAAHPVCALLGVVGPDPWVLGLPHFGLPLPQFRSRSCFSPSFVSMPMSKAACIYICIPEVAQCTNVACDSGTRGHPTPRTADQAHAFQRVSHRLSRPSTPSEVHRWAVSLRAHVDERRNRCRPR